MTIYDKIAKIQDEVQNITKDAKNPHFGNSYATYEKVIEVLNPILRKNNLVIYHTFGSPKFEGHIAVTTTIKAIGLETKTKQEKIDSSWGEDEITTTLDIPTVKDDPQAAGSAITYAKRYSILAMLGLGTEDDDGNAGSGRVEVKKYTPPAPVAEYTNDKPASDAQRKMIFAVAKEKGVEDVKDKVKDYFKLEHFEELTVSQAKKAIDNLLKLPLPKTEDGLVTNENGTKSWGKTEFSEPQ